MKIENSTALVTGSAQGIGQEISVQLAKRGARVLGFDLTEESQDTTKHRVETAGQTYIATVGDVSCARDIHALSETVRTDGMEIDILVNNAGVTCSGSFDEKDFSAWQRVLDVNLIGPMRLTYELLPLLKKRPRAHIVNIASIAGKFGPEGLAAYAAAKHGLVGLSSSLRSELSGKIGVTWVCPIYTMTRMIEGFRGNFLTPVITPADVARSVIRAINNNASEVFVPRWQWLTAAFLPTMFPTLSRWVVRRYRLSGNWLELKKDLPPDS